MIVYEDNLNIEYIKTLDKEHINRLISIYNRKTKNIVNGFCRVFISDEDNGLFKSYIDMNVTDNIESKWVGKYNDRINDYIIPSNILINELKKL